ncbi:TM2 domain-containing protein [Thiotrichales bacterium 19X7-9]|nr:TM2 domain-containing protein [Thiotrichales bacterium 19X7-9]
MDYIDQKRIEANQLNVTVAYLLWLFLGYFGAHRFYCKKPHVVTILVLEIIGLISLFIVIGIIPLMIVLVWWVIDATKIQKWVSQYNLGLVEQFHLNAANKAYQPMPSNS